MDSDVIDFVLLILRDAPLTVSGGNITSVADLMFRAEEQLNNLRTVAAKN